MESAITEAFLKSVQVSIEKCLADVKEESRKFAAALNAVKHIPNASQPDASHLEQRLATLELAYQRQVQKTIAGLSEDIGDLDTRLSAIEKVQEEPVNSWPYAAETEWPGPSKKNEVVIDDRSTTVDFGLTDLLVNVNHVEDDDDVVMSVNTVEVKSGPKEESKEEPEEEESLQLEEFEHEGESYYKDDDNNLYKVNDDGEVDETPIGRWLEKKKTIKLY
jgi:hypothetical protein